MANSGAGTVVWVRLGREDDFYFAWSPDVPGLHLCGTDRDALIQDIPAALAFLFRENSGVSVSVQPYAPVTEFPRPSETDDRFVVQMVA